MLRCKDVARLVASDEIDGFSFMKRMELRMHMLLCKHCQTYVEQLQILGRWARRLYGAGTSDSAVVARLEDRICRDLLGGEATPPGG